MTDLPFNYIEYTDRELRKPRLAEEYFTAPLPSPSPSPSPCLSSTLKSKSKSKSTESPVSLLDTTLSYYSNVQIRVKLWILLCQKPTLHIFRCLFAPLHLSEPHLESFWLLATSIHYNIEDPKAFFETLMELAIEEKVRFHSFASPNHLKPWIQESGLSDAALVKIYLCIRDGERYLRQENA